VAGRTAVTLARPAAAFGFAAALGFAAAFGLVVAAALARAAAALGFAVAFARGAALGFAAAVVAARRPMRSVLVGERLPSTLGCERAGFFAFLGLEDLSLIAGAAEASSEDLAEILQTTRCSRSTVIGPAGRAGR
jgi:hypothetical protein